MTNYEGMEKTQIVWSTGILTNPLVGNKKMSRLLALLLFVIPAGYAADSVNVYTNTQIGWQVSCPAG